MSENIDKFLSGDKVTFSVLERANWHDYDYYEYEGIIHVRTPGNSGEPAYMIQKPTTPPTYIKCVESLIKLKS